MVSDTRTYTNQRASEANERAGARLILAFVCARPLTPSAALEVSEGEDLVIGRNRLQVTDPWLSGEHARLACADGVWSIEDLGSKNGTFVNARLVSRATVGDGDVIVTGGTTFVFRTGADRGAGGLDERAAFRTLSAPLRRELDTMQRVARAAVPILLHGETGTGKDVLARAIHDASGRRGPYVPVNCGGLPPALVDSELHGARRGAYTGATADRAGLVAAAHTGTLFLDEIGELPLEAQASLLRTLQDGEVRPVGGSAATKVDVRVIAATHQDLEARAAEGRFRQDLLARLRGFRLTLPPLRDRREDLGLLIAALLGRIAPDRAPELRFERACAHALFGYDWPLNVRELELALRAAVAIAVGDEISLEHLPPEVRNAEGSAPAAAAEDKESFLELVRAHHGNVSEVARALRTSRTHVRRLARRFGVDLAAERGDGD